MNDLELLAPVGCEENFYAAVNFGADAVYIGLSEFSARKNAGNFSLERLPYVLSYAHLFGVKVYVAVNTLIKNAELDGYFETIKQAYICGADAFIVQDVFFGRYLKSLFPDIVIHLSTQAGINNLDGAKLAASYGFSRVILARETPIAEIKKIASFIETEVFIHGALCTSFSGHCYFSSFVGGKSGNRGLCRQPCRKLYKYEGKGIKDEYRYALSLADLSLSKRLDELIMAGVKSFKIEGRMRSFEYVCAACDFYSDALKGMFDKKKYDNLLRTYNRGNCTEGLGFGQDGKLISDKIQNHCGVAVGSVAVVKGDVLIARNLKTNPSEGDCFKIISDEKEVGNCVAVSSPNGIVLKFKGKASVGDVIAVTKDVSLSDWYSSKRKLFPVTARFTAEIGKPPVLIVNGKAYEGNFVCQKALTSAVTKSEIKENLRKTDVFPFGITPSCEMGNDLFILKRSLNELRARAYSDLFYSYAVPNEKRVNNADKIDDFNDFYATRNQCGSSLSALVGSSIDVRFGVFDNLIFCPDDYNSEQEFSAFFKTVNAVCEKRRLERKQKIYLYLPPFLTSDDEAIITEKADRFDGLYCEGASGIFLAKRLKKEIFGGVELNVTNLLSFGELKKNGAEPVSLSKELSYDELKSMPDEGVVLCGGSIKIMSLEYCPFGKKCRDCKRENRFVLRDAERRAFPVRRYKLSSCRFELYNCLPLKSEVRFENELFDFTMLGNEEKEYFLRRASSQGKNDADARKIVTTSGNLKKGVE